MISLTQRENEELSYLWNLLTTSAQEIRRTKYGAWIKKGNYIVVIYILLEIDSHDLPLSSNGSHIAMGGIFHAATGFQTFELPKGTLPVLSGTQINFAKTVILIVEEAQKLLDQLQDTVRFQLIFEGSKNTV